MYTDMIARIKNALLMKHKTASIPHSRLKAAIAKCLYDNGYISDFSINAEGKFPVIDIHFKYFKGKPAINKIFAISKPSLRRYSTLRELKNSSPERTYILSTSKGILSHSKAIDINTGGEVLCCVI